MNAHDKDGKTALMHAALNNQNPEVITTLLKAGADINAQDGGGATPLIWAAGHNKNPEVISELLKAGAAIDAEASDGVDGSRCSCL